MNDDLRVTPILVIPRGELTWRFSRSSGPGGQSVNTTDSRAEVLFDVARSPILSESQRARLLDRLSANLVDGVLSATSSEQRSQYQNRRAAAQRLADTLARALAPPPAKRRPTRPSRGAVERRLLEKKQRSRTKAQRRNLDD
ncbi:MAG: alternative ribosome rescue aminoacyl-tRNA hydrolase ArfB [Actinobacteria bacterium]|nr:alternative ribosome rescue aminoacyl-tRNA hydrolase ArfB [Actinomycetota bacterium]